MSTKENEVTLKKITAHCKEYGFVYGSSEIYDGLSAAYDYGPNGVLLKNNIEEKFCLGNARILGVLHTPTTCRVQASHCATFASPLANLIARQICWS